MMLTHCMGCHTPNKDAVCVQLTASFLPAAIIRDMSGRKKIFFTDTRDTAIYYRMQAQGVHLAC